MLQQLAHLLQLSQGVRQKADWPKRGSSKQAAVFHTQPLGAPVTHMQRPTSHLVGRGCVCHWLLSTSQEH